MKASRSRLRRSTPRSTGSSARTRGCRRWWRAGTWPCGRCRHACPSSRALSIVPSASPASRRRPRSTRTPQCPVPRLGPRSRTGPARGRGRRGVRVPRRRVVDLVRGHHHHRIADQHHLRGQTRDNGAIGLGRRRLPGVIAVHSQRSGAGRPQGWLRSTRPLPHLVLARQTPARRGRAPGLAPPVTRHQPQTARAGHGLLRPPSIRGGAANKTTKAPTSAQMTSGSCEALASESLEEFRQDTPGRRDGGVSAVGGLPWRKTLGLAFAFASNERCDRLGGEWCNFSPPIVIRSLDLSMR